MSTVDLLNVLLKLPGKEKSMPSPRVTFKILKSVNVLFDDDCVINVTAPTVEKLMLTLLKMFPFAFCNCAPVPERLMLRLLKVVVRVLP